MQDSPTTKTCTKCGRDLPFGRYHKAPGCRFGLRPQCKDCIHEARIAHYAKNADRNRAYSRAYYSENAEHVLKYQKRYSKQNKAKIAARAKRWREANRERLRAAKKADYEANKAHYLALSSIWTRQHPEYGRISHSKRRAKWHGAAGSFTAQEVLAKFAFHGWRCYLCHNPLTMKTLEFDHRIPLSRGGSNWIANIAPACPSCNQAKRQMTEKEYRLQLLQ